MLVLNENEPILTHLFVFRLMEVLYRFVKIKRGEMKHNTNFEESKVDWGLVKNTSRYTIPF